MARVDFDPAAHEPRAFYRLLTASVLPRQAALLTQVFPVLSRVEPFAEAPRLSEVRETQKAVRRVLDHKNPSAGQDFFHLAG